MGKDVCGLKILECHTTSNEPLQHNDVTTQSWGSYSKCKAFPESSVVRKNIEKSAYLQLGGTPKSFDPCSTSPRHLSLCNL